MKFQVGDCITDGGYQRIILATYDDTYRVTSFLSSTGLDFRHDFIEIHMKLVTDIFREEFDV